MKEGALEYPPEALDNDDAVALRAQHIGHLQALDNERNALQLPDLFAELDDKLTERGESLTVRSLAWMLNEQAMIGGHHKHYVGPLAIRGYELSRQDPDNALMVMLYRTKAVGAVATTSHITVLPAKIWPGGHHDVSLYSLLESDSLLRDLHVDWYRSVLSNPGYEERYRVVREVGALETMYAVNPWGVFNREEFDAHLKSAYSCGPSSDQLKRRDWRRFIDIKYASTQHTVLCTYAPERREPILPPAWTLGGDRVFESDAYLIPNILQAAVRPASTSHVRYFRGRFLGIPLYYSVKQHTPAGEFASHGWQASQAAADRMRIGQRLQEWAGISLTTALPELPRGLPPASA